MRRWVLFGGAALLAMLLSDELALSLPMFGIGPDLLVVVVVAFAIGERPRIGRDRRLCCRPSPGPAAHDAGGLVRLCLRRDRVRGRAGRRPARRGTGGRDVRRRHLRVPAHLRPRCRLPRPPGGSPRRCRACFCHHCLQCADLPAAHAATQPCRPSEARAQAGVGADVEPEHLCPSGWPSINICSSSRCWRRSSGGSGTCRC